MDDLYRDEILEHYYTGTEVVAAPELVPDEVVVGLDWGLVVVRIDVDGRVEVLWPESRYNDGFVYGNHTYTIPGPGDRGRLRVGSSKGVEYVEAIASAYPFDLRALGIDFRFEADSTFLRMRKISGVTSSMVASLQ